MTADRMTAEVVEARWRNVTAFLTGRGLDVPGLRDLLSAKVGDAEHALLTSSPVHGLANRTSDIDFIRIQREPLTGPRMATQIFEGANHMEVISFSTAEV